MWMEICAYGTSVVAEPLPSLRRRQRMSWSIRTRGRVEAPRSLPAGTVYQDPVPEDAEPTRTR
jgi:hypothetical protein